MPTAMGSMTPAATPQTRTDVPIDTPRKNPDLDVRSVVLGDIHFKTWYPSFYPDELVGKRLERLYVCQWCFRYTKDLGPYLTHRKLCEYKDTDPPGEMIYAHSNHAIFELDGEEHQLFAQNLSLFAKLFLDNKSVFFDVGSFNYYLLVHNTPPTHDAPSSSSSFSPQIIGFFSKEKMSWDNNNVACILIFPPWQRKGLGKILMGVSYELSKREGRFGGPEKPLSELGRKGYMQFWQARVAREVLGLRSKSSIGVKELGDRCWVLPEDIISALMEMGVCESASGGEEGEEKKNNNNKKKKKGKDGKVAVTKGAVREWVRRAKVDLTPPVDEEGFLGEWGEEEEEVVDG